MNKLSEDYYTGDPLASKQTPGEIGRKKSVKNERSDWGGTRDCLRDKGLFANDPPRL